MASRLVPPANDPIQPRPGDPIAVTIDGAEETGLRGQTIAGLMMAHGRLSWRTSSVNAEPRGVFCGIGVCFDCLVVVNGQRDVRACQRRAEDSDVVEFQHDELPEARL
jgi:predicted molibdopterin-dependent oxidoreductase YjgC